MNEFIESLGGVASWQFAVLTVGTWAVGGTLTILKWYFLPIPLFGAFFMFTLAVHHCEKAMLQSGIDPFLREIIGTMPILFALTMVVALLIIIFRNNENEETQH